MNLEVSTANGRVPVTILGVTGDLDASNSMELQKRADELIRNGTSHILLDLTHTPYVSSAGFRAIHTIYNQLRALHPTANLTDEQVRQGINQGTYMSPHLKLLNLSPGVRKVFQMTGFDMYIETYDDLKAAIAAF
jgi:anti-anti-sigma factor